MAALSMTIHFHTRFVKMRAKLSASVQEQCDARIELFVHEPLNPVLYNHALTGKYAGYRSINVTGSYRAHFKVIGENDVVFVRVGTHPQLYGE